MKIKRLKTIRINHLNWKIVWDKTDSGGSFKYKDQTITIGCEIPELIFETLFHELMEICMEELRIRYKRQDCDDFIFVLDHRQFTVLNEMFIGLLEQFIGG